MLNVKESYIFLINYTVHSAFHSPFWMHMNAHDSIDGSKVSKVLDLKTGHDAWFVAHCDTCTLIYRWMTRDWLPNTYPTLFHAWKRSDVQPLNTSQHLDTLHPPHQDTWVHGFDMSKIEPHRVSGQEVGMLPAPFLISNILEKTLVRW